MVPLVVWWSGSALVVGTAPLVRAPLVRARGGGDVARVVERGQRGGDRVVRVGLGLGVLAQDDQAPGGQRHRRAGRVGLAVGGAAGVDDDVPGRGVLVGRE